VVEAANGRLALEAVARERPAMVLLDLMMPEMDGFEFLDAFRRDPSGADIPVVVVTAMTLTEADRRRLNGGVARVVEKGRFGQDTLLAEVRALVGAR
jgi:CheY-like chemotaxis protein